MKKTLKKISGILLVVVACFFMFNVFADDKPEVVDYYQEYNLSAVLYSDGNLYLWGGELGKSIFDNVKALGLKYYNAVSFVDNDDNLRFIYRTYYYDSELQDEGYQTIESSPYKTGIKEIYGNHFITKDNKLYKYDFENYGDNKYTETLIYENVKAFSYYNNSYLILDTNNNLYAYGTNAFGKKINEGNDIVDEPLKIAENVKEFSANGFNSLDDRLMGIFYLTTNNELYIMSSNLPYPKKILDGVEKFLYNSYYIKDGKTYAIDYEIKNDNVELKTLKILDERIISKTNSYYSSGCMLTESDKFYCGSVNLYGSTNKLVKIKDDIKQILHDGPSDKYYILDKDSNFYSCEDYYVDDTDEVAYSLKKVISNVKKIIDSKTLIMENDTIYVTGGRENYDIADFNGTKGVTYNNYSVIKGLPNVTDEIVVLEIVLGTPGKTNFTVDEKYDLYAYVYPNNAVNKDIVWESSDESVATVSDNGTLTAIAPGKAIIKVKHKTLNLSDEVEITVYPKNTGIEIVEGDEITINVGKPRKLTAKVMPENILEQKLVWSTDAGQFENYGSIDPIITFFTDYSYEGIEISKYNEIGISARKIGKYTVTVTTEDGLFSDSITVNVVQGITSFGFDVDSNNLLGQTLYIYMSESKELDLKVVVYPENATDKEIVYTSSNENIATVNENGIVTAKKSGKVTIKVKAKNYNVERDINVLIFGNDITTKIGDVDGDGVVDILDLVKLRRHVAGVEALQ